MLAGISILGCMGIRIIRRDLYRQKLMQEKIVTEILELHMKAPFSDHFIVETNETWILDDCEKSDGSV